MTDAGFMVAVVGLGNALAFGQTSKHLTISKLSGVFAVALVPAFISTMWAISLSVGWWAIGVFLALSLIVGYINGIAARSFGTSFVYSLQPYLGTLFSSCAIACWFI